MIHQNRAPDSDHTMPDQTMLNENMLNENMLNERKSNRSMLNESGKVGGGRRPTMATLVLAFAVTVLAWGCSDSSPTEPNDVLVLEGTVAFQETSIQNFTMTVDGLMEITLDDLVPHLPEGTPVPASLGIGFALGRPVGEACNTSGALPFQVGDHASFGLDRGDFCLYFYDPGFIPADSSYDYTVTVRMTNF